MRVLVLVLLLLGAWPRLALAQTVDCSAAPPTNNVALVPGQTRLAWTQLGHTDVDVDNQPIITEYRGEVALASDTTFAKAISNWTIPKTSLTAVPAGGPNCYVTALPAMAGLLPANFYKVRVLAIGRTQTATGSVSSNGFFLPGAPPPGTNTRLYPPQP